MFSDLFDGDAGAWRSGEVLFRPVVIHVAKDLRLTLHVSVGTPSRRALTQAEHAKEPRDTPRYEAGSGPASLSDQRRYMSPSRTAPLSPDSQELKQAGFCTFRLVGL
jgi:hypothetical protein